MKTCFMLLSILCLLTGFVVPHVYAIYDPLSVPNNRYGIHIVDTNDIPAVAPMLNSTGGDWGYVTMVLSDGERNRDHWQEGRFSYRYRYDLAGEFIRLRRQERGRKSNRQFNDQGQPLCQAGLAMSLRYAFWCKTTLIPHERGRFICPLLYPNVTGEACPIQHATWIKGGCVTPLATSPGAPCCPR